MTFKKYIIILVKILIRTKSVLFLLIKLVAPIQIIRNTGSISNWRASLNGLA